MNMGSSWQQIDDAFERAVALEGEARRQFLNALNPGELRTEAGTHELLENLIGSAASTLDSPSETLKQAGPWRMERVLGQGGMGAVYLAERLGEDFRQTAALKLLRPGLGTRFFVSRFRQERRILATLDHPNIAQLLDGGAAEDGRPYIAIEYIDGEIITSFCQHKPRGHRIRLFLDVCRAVEHAHQRMSFIAT